MSEMIDDGLNLSVLDVTTQAEIDTYLGVMRRTHGPLYEMTSNALWLDSRPDFVKLHRRGARIFGRVNGVLDPVRGPLTGCRCCSTTLCWGGKTASSTRSIA